MANTGLPTGDLPMPQIWWSFREAIRGAPEIQVGRFVIRLVDQIRAAIRTGEFDELRAHVLGRYYSTRAQ